MLNFYHNRAVTHRKNETVYANSYECYKINQDNLSDIYHFLIKFDDFLTMFDMLCHPAGTILLDELTEHQNQVFYENKKPIFNFKEVDDVLRFCSNIIYDISNLYSPLQDCNFSLANSALRGLFDETYKQHRVQHYLNGNAPNSKTIELNRLFSVLQKANTYNRLFNVPFFDVVIDNNSNNLHLRNTGDHITSFSLKGVGSLLYGVFSEIHHKRIPHLRQLETRTRDGDNRKYRIYALNVLFGFVCIEILSLSFSMLYEHINQTHLHKLARGTEVESELKGTVMNVSAHFGFLRFLHEKVFDNYKKNIERYINELSKPFTASLNR